MKKISLGELEQQVMDIIWDCKNCSAREVLTKLEKDKKLAYTTVATILQRLYDKGLLERKENNAVYIYSAKISKEKYTKNVAQFFIKDFMSSFGDTAIASFAESIDELPKEKREYFLKILDEYDDKNK
jgi:predicted transcriptional regulator